MGDTRPFHSNVRFHVVQTTGLVDEKLDIVLRGLAPHQLVTLRAYMLDNVGYQWESHAVFRASEDGSVNLETQCPLEGTYEVPDSMGLFWSMNRQPSAGTKPTPLAPMKSLLTAEADGQ